MNYDELADICRADGLGIAGAFHPHPSDAVPTGCKTLVMLGPAEPGFWRRITASPEFSAADPVDQWSQRVIGDLAQRCGATPLFPFGPPPYQPFVAWALRTGRVWSSPIGLMVHDRMGLFLSFRGALAFEDRIALPAVKQASPCDTCAGKPCQTACPVKALTKDGYDLAACHDYLDGAGQNICLSGGCLVRRSCPLSQKYGRLAEQSAHHMRAFHKG